jgi:hypothetical protein
MTAGGTVKPDVRPARNSSGRRRKELDLGPPTLAVPAPARWGRFLDACGRGRRQPYFFGSSPRIIHGTGKSGNKSAPQTNQARSERPVAAAYFAVKRPDKNATARTGMVMKMIQENMAAPINAYPEHIASGLER